MKEINFNTGKTSGLLIQCPYGKENAVSMPLRVGETRCQNCENFVAIDTDKMILICKGGESE